MKIHLKNLKAAQKKLRQAFEALDTARKDCATKSEKLQSLRADFKSANFAELPALEAQVNAYPAHIEHLESELKAAKAATVSTAVAGLESLIPFINQREAAMRTAAMEAVMPFCSDASEARALLDRMGTIHELNKLAHDLAHDLEGRNPSSAIERIVALLEEATAEPTPKTEATTQS